jgi:hypothetical protein
MATKIDRLISGTADIGDLATMEISLDHGAFLVIQPTLLNPFLTSDLLLDLADSFLPTAPSLGETRNLGLFHISY